MRVAIPVTDGRIPNHFGHCAAFLIADVEGGQVKAEALVPNPGHGPGGPPPVFVAGQGVSQVLAWGMPPHAQGKLEAAGVKVLLGVTGEPGAALRAFLAGTLQLTREALDAGGGCGGHGH
jgi:predicted Fe-Mo cluster-binding NifX family protein